MEPPVTNNQLRAKKLTPMRMVLALAIAVIADGFEVLLGPIGWVADPAIDIVAMLLTSWLIGFHWLLLPTFILKIVPFAEELPAWTACVVAVILIRKREQRPILPPPLPSEKPTIEI